MEDVRCFSERQTLEIRPLTFLVGENSTGKTTALACFQVLVNYLVGGEIDFNQSPYSMGIFKDIVRNSRPKGETFKLGFTFKGESEDIECTIEFFEKKGGIEPTVKTIRIKFIDGEMVLRRTDHVAQLGIGTPVVSSNEGRDTKATIWREVPRMRLVSFDEGQNQYCVDMAPGFLDRTPFPFLFDYRIEEQPKGEDSLNSYLKKKEKRTGIIWWQLRESLSALSISPIRSRPKRTYDPMREFYDSEGSHVPMHLLETKAAQKQQWEFLKQRLVEFGKRSGLFHNIEIKNLGGVLGNPFQLRVKVRGPNSNIMDVGYGISQILPILVDILDPPAFYRHRRTFLLQQPEIHLHPRAQAELSSLLVTSANGSNKSFVIETHSDYMIDRARIEIRKGNIKPEDVSLIYFEPKGNIVKVHNISFDKMANMEGVPPHYRDFFLKESKRLMGFED
jgi:AAA15 family ATPase/GTPase